MYFVKEQHLLVSQISKDGGEIAFDLNGWPGGLLKGNSHFIGNDRGQRGFAQARRPVEQHMVERLAA